MEMTRLFFIESGTSPETMRRAANFVVAADDGIDFPLPGAGGEVGAVFFESLVFSLGILVGDFLGAAHAFHGFEGFLFIQPGFPEEFAGGRIAFERA
jgi:hypothetical protein